MKAKTLDIEGIENYLRDIGDLKQQEMVRLKTNAESYYSGYRDGVSTAISMMKSSNYEVEEDGSGVSENE